MEAVLTDVAPEYNLPGLCNSEELEFFSIEGCKQPPRFLGGDADGEPRVEHVLHHKPTKTMFITDHCGTMFGNKSMLIGVNTGGFRVVEPAKVHESCRSILAAEPQRLVFSHGDASSFIVGEDTKESVSNIRKLLADAYSHGFGLEKQSISSELN